jgi:hypothetical protein
MRSDDYEFDMPLEQAAKQVDEVLVQLSAGHVDWPFCPACLLFCSWGLDGPTWPTRPASTARPWRQRRMAMYRLQSAPPLLPLDELWFPTSHCELRRAVWLARPFPSYSRTPAMSGTKRARPSRGLFPCCEGRAAAGKVRCFRRRRSARPTTKSTAMILWARSPSR